MGWLGAFKHIPIRVDCACTGESGGDELSNAKDIFCKNALEDWEEGFVAGENHVNARV